MHQFTLQNIKGLTYNFTCKTDALVKMWAWYTRTDEPGKYIRYRVVEGTAIRENT